MKPLEAVRKFCVQCVGNEYPEVHVCGGAKCLNGAADENGTCWFYPHRMGKKRVSLKTIRKMCLWCQGGSEQFVRECGIIEGNVDCPLHPFRMATNPNYSEETREKLRVRLAQLVENGVMVRR